MEALFSTEGLNPLHSFRQWRDAISGWGVPLEQSRLDDGPFTGKLEAARLGPLSLMRITNSAIRSEATREQIQRTGKDGTVVVIFKLAGVSMLGQDDRSTVQRPGDMVVIDHRPATHESHAGSQALLLELPRERLESVLGSTRLYTAMAMGADVASTAVTVKFVHELVRLRAQLDPESAARMASIGVDLIVASIAKRLALEVSRPMQGTVVVQRAKAYVEAHLGDPTLDPPHLAAAVGVSLRRLQELFHARGQHISDWIWHRRLEVATKRLTDPGCVHLSIGPLAFGCGFANQAHFSRRFKERHGMTPREYRQAALVSTP
ncbi:helix-turn-helix domain-containing protein [Methylobacterium brachiatum]|uniref:helix-turn-helix domain-containing protein n=1 Tax=Methylobacterium brachiatum TaxID=269660 RepID=UPI000EFBC66B|nr:helix-turn-helix domain-containing protein [Methylobacterium brachiatum]AYO84923.1 helix-turn-helix domain-containing protein [Methylobacterium brachiatum]